MWKRIILVLLLSAAVHLAGAERIVSLSPNLTEIIFQLGQEHLLVGRSSSCNYPPEAEKLPVAGDYGRIFTESILALEPTLVVAEKTWDDSIPSTLRRYKIRHHIFTCYALDDYLKIIAGLGELLNCRKRADEIIADTRKSLEQLLAEAQKIPREKRPRVLLIISESPIVTAGKLNFINDMIESAGGFNIAASLERRHFTPVSPEWIIREQPDILIMPGATPERVRSFTENPAFKELPAVKNGRILTQIDPDLLFRLGPRTLDGIRLLRDYFREWSSGGHIQK